MRIKDVIVLWALLQIMLLPNAVFALETEDSHRSYCVRAGDNLNFDIQVHPELNGVYVSFYNPNDEELNDISFNIFISENDSNKIVNNIPVTEPVLHKNQIFCRLYEGINYSYNKDLTLFFWNLTYKVGEVKSPPYYSIKIDKAFRINKCIDINRWNRIEEIKYNGNIEIHDKIVFKKICSGDYKLNIDFKKLNTLFIPVNEAKISYDNRENELIIDSPSKKKTISMLLSEEIPLDKTITINLKYELLFDSEREEWKEMLIYPFSTLFYKFNTGNIIPEEAYLTSNGDKVENVKDVGSYTVEILLPEGYTHKGKASELEYIEEFKKEYIIGETNPPGVFYPSFSCLNVSSVPMDCLGIRYTFTPKQGSTYKKITWTSPIINGQPKKLSFDIKENYRGWLFIVLLISISVVIATNKFKRWYIESILGLGALLVTFRLALPIPPFLTLFEVVIISSIVLMLVLMLKSKQKEGELKEKPRIVEIMKFVLHPLTEKLDSNISMLHRNEFGYEHGKVKSMGIKELELGFGWGIEKKIYKSFKEECSEYAKKINEYDTKVGELKNAVIKLAEMIYTPAFEKECIKLVKKYNSEVRTRYLSGIEIMQRKYRKNTCEVNKKIENRYIDKSPMYLVSDIIDKRLIHDVYDDFWKKYGLELLQIREKPDIKEQIEKVETKSKKLVETSEKLKNEIEGLIKQYEKEYGICKGEYIE